MPNTVAPNYIDIFAGAGGISLGLFNAGWKGLFAIEKSEMAFETLKYNLIDKKNHFDWPKWLPIKAHDINDVLINYEQELKSLRNKVDLVTGGPPCQGFSTAGRRKHDDERNQLVNSYINFIKLVKPKSVFLENVTGFTIGFKQNEIRDRAYSEYVSEKLSDIGYNVDHKIIDFSEFGVPQKRRRFILIGLEKGIQNNIFSILLKKRDEFLFRKGLTKNITVGETISDLLKSHGTIQLSKTKFKNGVYGPTINNYQKFFRKNSKNKYPDSHRFTNHRKKTIERLTYILDNCPRNVDIGENVKKMFNLKKHCIIPMDENMVSPTLTTLPDDYIHYSEPRILTVREYARIQTFPDWYEIKNKFTTGGKLRRFEIPRYSQIGNAIPPLFVELVGNVLKEVV